MKPSDRAIAQAFWEWRTRSNYFRAKYSASIWVEERARELDATAAHSPDDDMSDTIQEKGLW